MKYVEVILPLPVEGTFTYGLADALCEKVKLGMRLLVPFGKSKMYVGICDTLPLDAPKQQIEGITYKEVLSILDEQPVLLPQQLKLWHWISAYYIAPIGDIYTAALPAGLKLEDGYKPRMETFVGIGQNFRGERELHLALDSLTRAVKQKKILTTYLQLSGIAENVAWAKLEAETDAHNGGQLVSVSQEELINESHCPVTPLRELIKKGILCTYQKEIGRLVYRGEAQPQAIKPLNEAQTMAYDKLLLQMLSHKDRKSVV